MDNIEPVAAVVVITHMHFHRPTALNSTIRTKSFQKKTKFPFSQDITNLVYPHKECYRTCRNGIDVSFSLQKRSLAQSDLIKEKYWYFTSDMLLTYCK